VLAARDKICKDRLRNDLCKWKPPFHHASLGGRGVISAASLGQCYSDWLENGHARGAARFAVVISAIFYLAFFRSNLPGPMKRGAYVMQGHASQKGR